VAILTDKHTPLCRTKHNSYHRHNVTKYFNRLKLSPIDASM